MIRDFKTKSRFWFLQTSTAVHASSAYWGAVALVGRLRDRVGLGVVASTWRGDIEVMLRATGSPDAFEFIVAKEDIAAPKSGPER
jgi:beta-phosphoglucomutase-like phosphatase (HAD superfamily)